MRGCTQPYSRDSPNSAGDESAGVTVPCDYARSDYNLPATGIASAVEALKGKVIFDPSTFTAWREVWETEREKPAGERRGRGGAGKEESEEIVR